jgi:hypothetical protein
VPAPKYFGTKLLKYEYVLDLQNVVFDKFPEADILVLKNVGVGI